MSDIFDVLKSTASGRARLKELTDQHAESSFAAPAGSAALRCVQWKCGMPPLTWLRVGESRQTNNGFLIAKVEGWYCLNCAGSYGNSSPPNTALSGAAKENRK